MESMRGLGHLCEVKDPDEGRSVFLQQCKQALLGAHH